MRFDVLHLVLFAAIAAVAFAPFAMSAAESLVPDVLRKPVDQDPDAERYWIGTLASCPVKDVHLAGICFTRHTGTEGNLEAGQVVRISAAKLAEIQEAVKHKVGRKDGDRGSIADTTTPNYVRNAGDTPIAAHIYMIPESHATAILGGVPQFRKVEPPSMLELAKRGSSVEEWIRTAPESEASKTAKRVLELEALRKSNDSKEQELERLRKQLAEASKSKGVEVGGDPVEASKPHGKKQK